MANFAFPSKEELDIMVEEGSKIRRGRAIGGEGLFTHTDLGDWIDLCFRADVPYIPATRIATGPTIALWEFDTEPAPDDRERVLAFWAAVKTFKEQHPVGWMMRWSCCSMADVKYFMSQGEPEWRSEFMDLYVDDMRAFDMIADFPKATLSAWARPWVKFDIKAGYPVEYRAFVADNTVLGISNYYPQRPLPDDENTWRDIDDVMRWTTRLIQAQVLKTNCPQVASGVDLTKNHFTADFARLPSGAVVFLEGGPGHYPNWGAHPCCFLPGQVSGVALENRGNHV